MSVKKSHIILSLLLFGSLLFNLALLNSNSVRQDLIDLMLSDQKKLNSVQSQINEIELSKDSKQ